VRPFYVAQGALISGWRVGNEQAFRNESVNVTLGDSLGAEVSATGPATGEAPDTDQRQGFTALRKSAHGGGVIGHRHVPHRHPQLR